MSVITVKYAARGGAATVAVDVDQRVRDVVAQRRERARGVGRPAHTGEERPQRIAAFVAVGVVDDQHAVGQEALDHRVVAPAVTGVVVARDRVAHCFARQQLGDVHAGAT